MGEWSSQRREVRVEIDRIMSAIEARHKEIAEASLLEIAAQIDTYAAPANPDLTQDVYQHIDTRILDFVRAAKEDRTPSEAELEPSRAAVIRRAEQGLPLESILHAVRVGQRTVWNQIVEEAGAGEASREAALALAGNAMGYLDVVSSDIAEVYVCAVQDARAGVDREERDVLETLLSGRFVLEGQGRERLERIRLRPDETFHLVLVRFDQPEADEIEGLLGRARTAIKLRLADGPRTPIVVVRQREIVGIVPGVADTRTAEAIWTLAVELESEEGPDLRAGISDVLDELADVPSAYDEADVALQHTSAYSPVLKVGGVALREFLLTTANPLYPKLIPQGIQDMAADEGATALNLVDTVFALARASGNIQVAAAELDVHPNTVRNRLGQIESLTGTDPKSFYGLQDLVVGFRLLGKSGA